MAKIIKVNFPSGQKEEELITAYKRTGTDGAEFVVTTTGKVENGNTVVGVSCKSVGEESYQNIVDIEQWQAAKKDLVSLLKNKEQEEGLSYIKVEESIFMTEDGKHEIALREDNLIALKDGYEKALNQQNEVVGTQNFAINTSQVQPAIVENPSDVFAGSIQQNSGVVYSQDQVAFQDVAPKTGVEVSSEKVIPSMNDVSTITPIIQDINQNIQTPFASEKMIKDVSATNSAVVNSYLQKSSDLMSRLDGVITKFNATTAQLTQEINEIHNEFGALVKEGSEYHNLAGQTLNKVQEVQAMASNSGLSQNSFSSVAFPSIENEESYTQRVA